MNHCITRDRSQKLAALLAAAVLSLTAGAGRAADEAEGAPRGPAVTVLKAAKYCFNNNVEVSGIVMAREETSVRPERQGAKVAAVEEEQVEDVGDNVFAAFANSRLQRREVRPSEGSAGTNSMPSPVRRLAGPGSARRPGTAADPRPGRRPSRIASPAPSAGILRRSSRRREPPLAPAGTARQARQS